MAISKKPVLNLRPLRQKAGLSLSQAATLTGVSKAMLGQVERGESSPTLETLWKLAKGFDLPLTALITDLLTPDAPQAATAAATAATDGTAISGQVAFPGSITVRSGTCYKCLNCGNSMGCS